MMVPTTQENLLKINVKNKIVIITFSAVHSKLQKEEFDDFWN